MIFIPCEVTRQWALDVAFWHSGNCSFTVTKWSPNLVLTKLKLEFAPVWILFKNVPPELWSLEGFSSFATGVGFPVQSEFPKLKPYTNGIIKLKVVIKLEGKKSKVVKVVGKMGNSVNIYVEYLKLPPKCRICSEFGHFDFRCPSVDSGLMPLKLVEQGSCSGRANYVIHSSNKTISKKGPVSPRASSIDDLSGGRLRRSVSLPGSPIGYVNSETNAGASRWIRVGTKSPSAIGRRSLSPPSKAKPLSSAQFASEEEMIGAAQKILRNRLNEVVMDIPPFSNSAARKRFRKHQRQTFRSVCEDEGGASIDSGLSVNKSQDPIAFGSIEAVLPKQASTFLEA